MQKNAAVDEDISVPIPDGPDGDAMTQAENGMVWARDRVKLLADHEHAGRAYAPGAVLALADTGLAPGSAQWLVDLGKAEWL